MSENNQVPDQSSAEFADILKRRREAAIREQALINTKLIADPPTVREMKEDMRSLVQPKSAEELMDALSESSKLFKEETATSDVDVEQITSVIVEGTEINNIYKSTVTTSITELPESVILETTDTVVEGTLPVEHIPNEDITTVSEPIIVISSDIEEDDESDDIQIEDDIIDENDSTIIDDSGVFVDTGVETKPFKQEGFTPPIDGQPELSVELKPVKIGSVGERKNKKRISSLKPGPNVKVVSSEEYQRAVVEQYITKTSGDSFTGPKSISRVILPYSGIFYDISSYTNVDMLGIHRSTVDISFVEKIEKELISAWEHTVNNSFKRKIEFPEWLRSIKYPDLWCIYWGIYNVNHPGINVYRSECDKCPEIVEEKRDNYKISFVSPKSEADIDQTIIDKIRNGTERDFISSYKVASTLIERADYLSESKFKVFFGMPSMEDVMVFLKYLKVDLEEEDPIIRRVLYPLSYLELERDGLSKGTISKILTYKYMMYVRKLHVPVYEELKDNKIKVTYVNVEPIMIYPILNDLSSDDFKEMVKSSQLRNLMIKEGIHFRVKDSVCPKCNTPQRVTALDMRDVIFSRAEALAESLMNT